MTLQCEMGRVDFHPLHIAHDRSSPPPPQRPLLMPRTQDTLASLYKRQSTLNQQLASTRLLLEQQHSENKQTMTLATARDRANGKLQRKLERLKATLPPPDQPLVPPPQAHQRQKQQWALLQEEHCQWQQKVDQQQRLLEEAKEKTRQAHQQLVCLSHISQTINTHKRYQDLATHHALLDSLRSVRDLYVDWIQDMTTRWAFLCGDDDASLVARMGMLEDELQRHLDQDRTIQAELQDYLGHLMTLQKKGDGE